MKKNLKYSHVCLVTLTILILNVIVIFLFRENIQFSRYSIYPTLLALAVLINGGFACIYKHRGNYLMFRGRRFRWMSFLEDKEYTFTEEYERTFRWMLMVYFAAIPFYLPVICFATTWQQISWSLLVAFVPQGIFIGCGIAGTIGEAKKERLRQAQLEKERIEQERREELGRWK